MLTSVVLFGVAVRNTWVLAQSNEDGSGCASKDSKTRLRSCNDCCIQTPSDIFVSFASLASCNPSFNAPMTPGNDRPNFSNVTWDWGKSEAEMFTPG